MLNITYLYWIWVGCLANVNLLQDFYLVGLLPFEFKINYLLVFSMPESHLPHV